MKKISDIQKNLLPQEQMTLANLAQLKGGGKKKDDKRRQRPGGGTTTTSPCSICSNED